ncbi:hypothetical protein O3P69_005279 [Scylla paramamosain]|uniref:Uncharacterized protein n=1 Tax=Scylla paramamosain TaxID=85552 RepID=A0AAW0UBJ1_SCYPA
MAHWFLKKAFSGLIEPCDWFMLQFLELEKKLYGQESAISVLEWYKSDPCRAPAHHLAYHFYKNLVPVTEQLMELEPVFPALVFTNCVVFGSAKDLPVIYNIIDFILPTMVSKCPAGSTDCLAKAKRARTSINLEMKLVILRQHTGGEGMNAIVCLLDLAQSSVSIVLKNTASIRKAVWLRSADLRQPGFQQPGSLLLAESPLHVQVSSFHRFVSQPNKSYEQASTTQAEHRKMQRRHLTQNSSAPGVQTAEDEHQIFELNFRCIETMSVSASAEHFAPSNHRYKFTASLFIALTAFTSHAADNYFVNTSPEEPQATVRIAVRTRQPSQQQSKRRQRRSNNGDDPQSASATALPTNARAPDRQRTEALTGLEHRATPVSSLPWSDDRREASSSWRPARGVSRTASHPAAITPVRACVSSRYRRPRCDERGRQATKRLPHETARLRCPARVTFCSQPSHVNLYFVRARIIVPQPPFLHTSRPTVNVTSSLSQRRAELNITYVAQVTCPDHLKFTTPTVFHFPSSTTAGFHCQRMHPSSATASQFHQRPTACPPTSGQTGRAAMLSTTAIAIKPESCLDLIPPNTIPST